MAIMRERGKSCGDLFQYLRLSFIPLDMSNYNMQGFVRLIDVLFRGRGMMIAGYLILELIFLCGISCWDKKEKDRYIRRQQAAYHRGSKCVSTIQ